MVDCAPLQRRFGKWGCEVFEVFWWVYVFFHLGTASAASRLQFAGCAEEHAMAV